MTQESKFNEFFEELGGIDNLKLMVNIKNIIYGEVHRSPAVDFTLGWEKRAEFRIIRKKPFHFYEGEENGDNYFIYVNGLRTTFLVKRIGIRTQMSNLVRHHTGYEIFF